MRVIFFVSTLCEQRETHARVIREVPTRRLPSESESRPSSAGGNPPAQRAATMSRPEEVAPPEVFYDATEAGKYLHSTRTVSYTHLRAHET